MSTERDDAYEQLCARLDEEISEKEVLAKQLDEAEREAGYWKQLAEKLQRDKNALAAHLDRIQDARIGLVPSTLCPVLAEAIDSTPTTSLARRDMLQQAEEVERIADELREDVEGSYFASWLDNRADKLRRQAEGGEA